MSTPSPCSMYENALTADQDKVIYKVMGMEMKGVESSMKLVALGATQRRG